MPHISDGNLHAWIDGAFPKDSPEGLSVSKHLDTCPDCRSRLEDARHFVAEAGEILAAATPDLESVPAFEEIQARAAEADLRGDDHGRGRIGGSLRAKWRSFERLAWAATVVLALGAGWIGRTVLIDRGWSDPFHESALDQEPVAENQAVGSLEDEVRPSSTPLSSEGLGADTEDPDRANKDEPVENAAAAPSRREEAAKTVAEPDAAGELGRRERSDAVAPAELEVGVELDAVDAAPDLKRDRESRLEENVAQPDTLSARLFVQPSAVQPAQDPWHQLPDRRRSPAAAETGTCFRVETGWSTGVASLPGRIELSPIDAETRPEDNVFGVSVLDGSLDAVLESVWAAFGADSLWVRIVTGPEADVFTIRAGRVGMEWVGEARTLSPSAPVQPRQRRGPVRLVPIGCP